ncbi:Zn-dependent hydrolase [Mesorhizobium sp.]|uniref:Zn-dependent hydrolase n=1 Tax=Mesorhizobium sp. TaxID=1871066 RepID=UPI000FE7ED0B|nr:Zn-dependent hydrolase [Mesorhizobium sp.]RWJ32002.1 MAG: Zn-dependent hydrolase [Mesorhizobium sp.]TIQ73792.1 MAG: Zn-dependent hydrolase [Mesorhizobium sp.]
MKNALEINGERLWDTLMVSGQISPGKSTGLDRLALTDGDRAMRDVFVGWCKDAGCTITIDPFGNIFARRAGRDPQAKPVVIGSHLDTQIAGGKFDGVLGVLSGLELIRTLNDLGIETKRPIEVVSWTNEEGVRFQPPMLGAGAFAGIHEAAWVLGQTDPDGIRFGAELERIGYAGSERRDSADIDAYFELHIEQGPVLEEEGLHVGIVTGGFTSLGAEVEFRGENAHAGPTLMRDRKDALVGAAVLIAKVNEIGWEFAPKGRATCARLEISPNRYGIIADRTVVTVDVRHPEASETEQMYRRAMDVLPIIAKQANVEATVKKEWRFGGLTFDAELVNLVRTVAAEMNVPHRHLLSAAGHDAYHVATVAPTVMIFTPCRGGVTHNESEHIELHYTVPGVNVLLNAVVRRANA